MTDYKKAGVNIEEGYEAVNLIRKYAEKTKTNGVLNGLGSFAGMFEMAQMKHPVLVSGTDGVGTKLEVAFKKNVYDTGGIDCVSTILPVMVQNRCFFWIIWPVESLKRRKQLLL
jgi:phosphoribosylformylglycinamidine cyclo-ligase